MNTETKPFALCIDNTDYEELLIRGKVYRVLPDPKAARKDMVRVVDESDEDGLYHKSHFELVDFSSSEKRKAIAMGGAGDRKTPSELRPPKESGG